MAFVEARMKSREHETPFTQAASDNWEVATGNRKAKMLLVEADTEMGKCRDFAEH